MMNLKRLLLILTAILLIACGSPPLVQPEGQEATQQAAETATVVAEETAEVVGGSTTSPLPTPIPTATVVPTEAPVVATPVSPLPTPPPKPIVGKEIEILKDGHFGWLGWSPDGSKLLYTKFSNEFLEIPNGVWERGEIWLFDLDTADNKQLVSSGQVATWSPDGQRLALSIINPNIKEYDIAVYDFNTQSVTPVGSSPYYYSAWTSNQELFFIADQSLRVVDTSSRKIINEIELDKASVNNPRRITQLNSQIITYDKRGQLAVLNTGTGQAESTLTDIIFDWIAVSPSTQELAYITQDIPPAFGILNPKTGENRLLLQAGKDFTNPRIFNPVWSPDGKFITITASKTTGTEVPTDVYLLDAASGVMYEPPLIENVDATSLVWSPSGKHLAFTRSSTSESTIRTSIFVVELK